MKKALSLLLSLCLLLGLLPVLGVPAKAAEDTSGLQWRMEQILRQFPDMSFSTTTGEYLCSGHGANEGLVTNPCYQCRDKNIIKERYQKAVRNEDAEGIALFQRLYDSLSRSLAVQRTPGVDYLYNGKTVMDTMVEGSVTCRAFANTVWYLLYGFHDRKPGVTCTQYTDAQNARYGDFVWIPKDGYHYAIFLGWKDGKVGGTMLLYESNAFAGIRINGGSGAGQTGRVSQITYKSEYAYKSGVKFGHPFNYDDMNAYYKSQTHVHDYNDRGICTCSSCLAYSFPDDAVSFASYRKKAASVYRVTKDGAPLRSGPYKICPEIRSLSAGTELVVTGRLENAEGNRWYEVKEELRDGAATYYIYSENVKYTRDGVTLTDPGVEYKPNANEILSSTVSKLSGMNPEKYGCYLLNNTKARWNKGFQRSSSWNYEEFQEIATCFEAADPNSGNQSRINATQYQLSVDLAKEGGFSLVAGDEYIAQLFVRVDGHYYYSNLVKFIAGVDSSESRGIEPSDSPSALGEAADASAWLIADNTDPLGAQDVTFIYGVEGAGGYTVVADYASGGNYCRHVVGSRTDHALRFEELGDFVCYVIGSTPQGQVRTNSVVIHVHDPSGGAWTGTEPEPYDPGPFCDFSPADEQEYRDMEFVDERSACLVTRIDKRWGSHIDRCGFTLYDENGETVFAEQWSGDGIPDDYTWSYLWYTVGADSGWLRPGTLYYYTFDVIINGRQFISDRRSFTTLRPLAERLRIVEPVTVDFYGGKDGSFTTERFVPAGSTWGWFTDSGGTGLWYEGLPVLSDPYADFLGWFTARQGGTHITEGAAITATGSAALYAHWQPYTYYLDLDPNGGTVNQTRIAYHHEETVALPTPMREGYTFLGWFTSPDGYGMQIKPDTVVYTGMETLYAHWQRKIDASDAQGNPFTDVAKGSWYYSWVSRAYAAKLINGKSATRFAPNDNISLAEALKLAACVRQLLTDGAVTLQNSASGPWYMSYVDFLKENKVLGIEIGKATDYQRKITRAEMVRIFYAVIPSENRAPINDIPADAIPDVGMLKSGQALYWFEVLGFYRAGILNGSDEYGTFHPDDYIQRSAVAAILVRIIDPSTRLGPPAKLGQK